MEISQSGSEQPIVIRDRHDFVSSQDVAAGDTHTPAYTIDGPLDKAIAIGAGTLFAPEFYDTNGDPIDDSTTIIMQKVDEEGNRLGGAIVFEDTFDVFNYEKFRSDTDYFVTTHKSVVLNEREALHVILDIPSGEPDFDGSASRLTIGDKSTKKNQPAFIRDLEAMTAAQRQGLDKTAGGN